jgi:hypothetical protein
LYTSDREATLLKYFKGFVLTPGENNQCVLGYNLSDSSAYLRIHYYKSFIVNDTTSIDLAFTSSHNQFNQIKTIYKKGSKLFRDTANKSKIIISSDATDHCAYMQAGTGLAVRIEFPNIKDLLMQSKYFKILRAELVIKPVLKTYSDTFPVPSSMYLYTTDENNTFGSALKNSESTAMTGSLFTDLFYPINTCYTYDVSSYINSLIYYENTSKPGLLLINPDFYSTLNRLVIGDRMHPENNISLKIYYLNYAK